MPDKKWRIWARRGCWRQWVAPNRNSAIRNSVRASAVHTLVQLRWQSSRYKWGRL